MIRIERVALPEGLRAVARRDEHGNLVIFVSAELDSRQQRAAVLEAVRASRRAGWRAALPIWVGLAAGLRFWLRRLQSAIRTQPAAFATGVGAVVAGAVVAGALLATPGSHGPLAFGGSPGGSPTSQGGPGQPGGGHARRHVQPVASHPSGPVSGGPKPGSTSPGPGRSSRAPGRHSSAPSSSPPPGHSSSPSPTPSTGSPTHTPTTSPTPTPRTSSPKPSPKPTKTKDCIIILGIKICVGL